MNTPERILLDARVFPSHERTIVSLVAKGDGFRGAHNYDIKPMLRYEGGAVYGAEGMPITFIKKNDDGTWQPGLQSEQLLLLLLDRHEKLNSVFPTGGHNEFRHHLIKALECLEYRVRERTERGVMGDHRK